MYNIYYNGEIIYSNIDYNTSMDILKRLAEEGNHSPEKIDMILIEDEKTL